MTDQCSPATETHTGCICQDQHRRGYCTEPGCPYSDPEIMKARDAAATPSTADAEKEWSRLNSVFHKALEEYPHSHHALHYLWNNAIAGPVRTTGDAAQPSNMREALEAALAFIDTALVADENPTMSKRAVVKTIRNALSISSTQSEVGK